MKKLFGTDGIRGRANVYPMTPEMALKTGRAIATFFARNSDRRNGILIGKDTRVSGDMLENALAAGICSMGMDVYLAGVLPTPGVAYLSAEMKFAAGIVISASHNPYDDNGIKLFNAKGFKLDDNMETQIEALIMDEASVNGTGSNIGRVRTVSDAVDRYAGFLASTFKDRQPLPRFNVVLDCANGATFQAAPKLFESMGMKVQTLFNDPDGKNINAGCGSQHPEKLAQIVKDQKADVGLAFDGDGDRLIAVDETGMVLSGDQILAVCARNMKEYERLKNNLVVSTVMSNMGFKKALTEMGIKHKATKVGDRYVMQEMVSSGAMLGGEDSGHMIFMDKHTTGDGLLAALELIAAMADAGRTLSDLSRVMTVFPQVLINVDVASKPDMDTLPHVTEAIARTEKKLGAEGRVLVRYSGTQSQCRIMVEASQMEIAQKECQRIAEVIRNAIGM